MRRHDTETAPDLVRRPGQTVAELIAGYLRWRGVERVYFWFCDFAPAETLAAFGEEVIRRIA